MKLIDEAVNSLNLIKPSDIFYAESKVLLADLLTNSSQENLAVNELKKLIDSGITNFEVYEALGNVYRYGEQFDLANKAYSEALRLKKKSDLEDQNLWLIYFFRGIAREQLKEYKDSIADLRKSLELRPAQPQVLNYLGYMLIERKENLDEALDMIEEPKVFDIGILEEIKKRLNISDSEFNKIMNNDNKSYRDYKTYKQTFEDLRPLFWAMYKLDLVPKSFYLKYTKTYD